jgi:hypothetical protein
MPEWIQAYSDPGSNSYRYLRRALTLAEAHQQVGNLTEASEWLQNASTAIETYGQDRLRPRAALLSQRL